MTPEQQKAVAIAKARRRREASKPPLFKPKSRGDEQQHLAFDGSKVPGYNPETGLVERSPLASAAHGAADVASFGFGDEIAAGLVAPFSEKDYGQVVGEMRNLQQGAAEDNPNAHLAGMVAGGIGSGVNLARNGLSFAVNAARGGGGLGRVAAGSAADGALIGAAQGAGSGEDLEDRFKQATAGTALGGIVGAAAPYALAGLSAAIKPLASPVLARLDPERYASAALDKAVQRSGSNPEAIARALADARADDQAVYTVADALGLTGQRVLSTVARNPGDTRQAVHEALHARQAGQGRRVVNALSEALSPDTAAERTAALTAARSAEANALYGAARQEAKPVNVSSVVQAIDDTIQPGVHSIARPNNQIASDSIEGALARVRSMLTDDKSNLTDFNAVFRAKLDLDDMITKAEGQGAGNRAHYLADVQRKLDGTLADASEPYATARDAFSAASRRIEAVDTGRSAAQRGRTEDTVAAFNAMTPEEQSAFRAGYADPLVSHVQGAAVGVDKSRPLISDATAREFAAFAEPGKGRQLWDRLGREKRMFETRAAATGGSRTADNLADATDLGSFDPSVAMSLLRGRPMEAAMSAVARALNEARGLTPGVMDRVARALMETDPAAARATLDAATRRGIGDATKRARAATVVNALMGAGAGRL